jgi:hypothetical protein
MRRLVFFMFNNNCGQLLILIQETCVLAIQRNTGKQTEL